MHMTVIAQKAEKTLILKGEFILGILIIIAAVIGLPVVVFSIEEGLIREPLLCLLVCPQNAIGSSRKRLRPGK